MDNIQQKFGARIKSLRLQKNMSQEDLSSKTGLHRTYISDIERGIRNVSLKNIEKIAKALSVSPDVLLR
ncbi:transcriptional regulator [Candidatus Falkowbacteria bacterium CG10_big_fil_rev_8_21_14_0_10_43_10]|uniref:Transcriptional regulator n=1 Tax=Candidatus Falkowbacteria bacterium CG10_big_fil_rev_8_21_14_0_10_43_10 TaxID=1974567 RepID=A0A2H0V343_9BACT|nr:MAG: transcriptional regulator [Candidatus Falkowbacteria bacterium CG10_big_fil_rev_8_21_14_0_10_43_10]